MATAREIEERRQRLRLPVSHLAKRAGLYHEAVHSFLDGSCDTRLSTAQKIEAVIVAEELALRDHLVGLHGLPEAPAGRWAPPAQPIAA